VEAGPCIASTQLPTKLTNTSSTVTRSIPRALPTLTISTSVPRTEHHASITLASRWDTRCQSESLRYSVPYQRTRMPGLRTRGYG
jgi:hypothetical protein